MTAATQFIPALRRERRNGNVSSETEQHLKHEFRKLGVRASESRLAPAIGTEADRLEREPAILRKLKKALFGAVYAVKNTAPD
jgi:hypothetical protein